MAAKPHRADLVRAYVVEIEFRTLRNADVLVLPVVRSLCGVGIAHERKLVENDPVAAGGGSVPDRTFDHPGTNLTYTLLATTITEQ